jgi:hypothetical protein
MPVFDIFNTVPVSDKHFDFGVHASKSKRIKSVLKKFKNCKIQSVAAFS